jgi:hypothetical protein
MLKYKALRTGMNLIYVLGGDLNPFTELFNCGFEAHRPGGGPNTGRAPSPVNSWA